MQNTKPTPAHIEQVYRRADCLHNKAAVEAALDKMAVEMTAVLKDKNPLLLCVMVGGIIPAGQLLVRLDFPLQVDYAHASRYNGGTRGQELQWIVRPRMSLEGRTVVVIDDILDGGVTLAGVLEECRIQNAGEIHSVVLVDKETTRLPGGLAQADFVGLTVPDRYVFGYGLDYKGYLRNAPGIFAVAPEDL